MKGGIDGEIERLYQLPLEDFTAARHALAKGAGARAAEVRELVKPPLAAWAINQLYWRKRPVFDALIAAAQEMRRAHAAVLSGRAGDVRAAGTDHEARVGEALDAAIDLLKDNGHPATDATRQSMATTLRALPADEPSGMLTRTLLPGGFEALAGLSIRGATVPPLKPAAKPIPHPTSKASKDEPRDSKAMIKAREAVASATRALEAAENAARREEFERARSARDHEKAVKAVAAAQEAVEQAQSELADAQAAAATAAKKKDASERRAQEAEKAVDTAQAAVDAAKERLDALGS